MEHGWWITNIWSHNRSFVKLRAVITLTCHCYCCDELQTDTENHSKGAFERKEKKYQSNLVWKYRDRSIWTPGLIPAKSTFMNFAFSGDNVIFAVLVHSAAESSWGAYFQSLRCQRPGHELVHISVLFFFCCFRCWPEHDKKTRPSTFR